MAINFIVTLYRPFKDMSTRLCRGRGDGFKRLQRIGNDAAANDDLIGCAHKISSWPQKAQKILRDAIAIKSCKYQGLIHGLEDCAKKKIVDSLGQAKLSATPARENMKSKTHLIRTGAITLAFAMVFCNSGQGQTAKDNSAAISVSNKLAAIRAAGDPVTLADLNNSYVEPPAGENAAEIYGQAFAALTPAKTPEEAKTLAYLTQNQKAITLLLQAAERKACRYPLDFNEGADLKLPHLAKIKTSANLLQNLALFNVQHGNTEIATKSALAGIALSRSLDNEPLAISYLVDCACLSITFQGLEEAFTRKAFTEAQLQRLQTAISECERAVSCRKAMVGERAENISKFQMPPDELAAKGADLFTNVDLKAYLKSPKFQQDFNFSLDSFYNQVALAEMPFPQCLAPEARSAIPNNETAKAKGFLFSAMLLPDLSGHIEKSVLLAARIRVTQTALAVERYRLKHANGLPGSLTDLVPEYIATIPDDPFNGQPLRYRKFEDKGYVVYSVGKNLHDDNGVEKSPDGKTQLDVTFTVKR